ncbi:hypothetical protein GCM10022255_058240 [Dactylosporangium darangshiense]|uniref:Uncharacterized protein n=1 Tax=Dactylosporangium darangshiense TaxID=579108 RepID=A0ABP8DFM7_9ACTN
MDLPGQRSALLCRATDGAALDSRQPGRIALEREGLTAQLAAAYGIDGRARRAGSPGERARTEFTTRIRDVLRRIEAVHPELGAHLRASVRTGALCSYRPAGSTAGSPAGCRTTEWSVDPV